MSIAIELKNITVSYRENVALQGVSLTVKEGELVAVVGPNGAGKTTLLTAINGLGRLVSGAVRIFGEELNGRNLTRIRKTIGYVPQNLNIDPRMPISVREVVMIGRYGRAGPLRKTNDRDRRVVDEIMDLVGIAPLASRPIGHLSGGELQKVQIARALAQEPRILLLDEPTSNLDLNARRSIVELIEEIHRQGKLTILVVMHELSHLPKGCQRIILMKNAEIVFSGDVQETLSEGVLSQIYDCPVKIMRTDEGVIVQALRER